MSSSVMAVARSESGSSFLTALRKRSRSDGAPPPGTALAAGEEVRGGVESGDECEIGVDG